MADIDIPPSWKKDESGKSISRTLTVRDFSQGVDIINQVRDIAEDIQHHPDVILEEYNRLTIRTWSHDVGGLTQRDENLAKLVNEFLNKIGHTAEERGRTAPGAGGRIV